MIRTAEGWETPWAGETEIKKSKEAGKCTIFCYTQLCLSFLVRRQESPLQHGVWRSLFPGGEAGFAHAEVAGKEAIEVFI